MNITKKYVVSLVLVKNDDMSPEMRVYHNPLKFVVATGQISALKAACEIVNEEEDIDEYELMHSTIEEVES